MIIIIAILAAIAIPMYLNQRNKAKDAAVREGIHSIQIGIQTYAVDNNDAYPAATNVLQTGTVGPVRRQLAAEPLQQCHPAGLHGAERHQRGLQLHAGSTAFSLSGHLSTGNNFTVP